MRDLVAHAVEHLWRSTETLRRFFGEHGYLVVDTPLIEETDLFVRKSGGELTSRLYTFTDPGGHEVSLRPEFTPSVIRHYIENGAEDNGVARWQYSGPVLRYEQGETTGYRQFTQAGAELVGVPGAEADAEALWLAWAGLAEIGAAGHRLRLGHVGVLHDLIESYGLSEAANLFIASNVQALKAGRTDLDSLTDQAQGIGLLRRGNGASAGAVATPDFGGGAPELLRSALGEFMPRPFGARSPEQVIARLLRKVGDADEPNRFRSALEAVNEFSQLEGRPDAVLSQARSIAAGCKRPGLLDGLADLLEALTRREMPEAGVVIDLGLAMGISYYTGVIFEIVYDQAPGASPLGSGGRYDGLVKALGGRDEVPALGFAYNLDHSLAAMAG